MGLKIIYAGTPDFAAAALRQLLTATDHQIVAVYTQPDRPAGRGRKLQASPVKELALEHNIPVEQPERLKDQPDTWEQLRSYNADLMVVAAYGLLLPKEVLEIPRLGCINIHASLLPRWRGAAPIHRAILAGDTQSGITIMQMDEGLDTGAMLYKVSTPIESDETSASLHDRLADLGGMALIESLSMFEQGKLEPEPQDDQLACYAKKLHKEEADIDWHASASTILRQINAFIPWPVSQTSWEGKKIRIWGAVLPEPSAAKGHSPGTVIKTGKEGIEVACGERSLLITHLQLPGKRQQDSASFLNAHQIEGAILSATG